MNVQLLALKAKVCGFEHAARGLRRRISTTKGERRWSLRSRKSMLGAYTREHLIAYGLLRGLTYERIEPKCDERNKPNIDRVTSIVQEHVVPWERGKWQKERVAQLLVRSA